ncbi:uncharacterized protein LOC126615549 isoform X1 [Malus sylvestris]|uniref:uncharacterized protein LOC126615549 isoform X1 n=1 Tax=Malus sylvestris TaxID=3752 RepID=UPI0021ABF676|nr:uncharacterized protein LOC126615549 isoform X1 [Malus sylvestris]
MLTRRFQTIPDSDQSISDEEESDRDFPNNCAAIGGSAKKKEELPLSSRLEMLKDAGASVYACNLEDELSSDEEGNNMHVKVPVTLGAKKLQKDYVHCIGSDKEDESYTWSEVSKEAEALMRLNEQTSCSSPKSDYSKVNKSVKGVKDKGKPKFSFRFKTQKEGPSCFSVSKNESDMSFKVQQVPEMLKATEPRTEEYLDSELIEDIQGEEEKQLEIVPVHVNELGHGSVEQSMAELLDGLQDKTSMLRGRSKMYRRKRRKRAQPVMKIVSSLGDRVVDSESSPEHLGLGSPSNSEQADDQILKLDKPEVKRQTLVDRFQEALSDRALVAVPKPLRIGLFGQLQQVVQSDKESDMEFLKNIENRANQNEPSCIDVKILSRYLDAKLTVCHCSFGNNVKRLPWQENPKNTVNEETTWTIIFNPRVCDDVDLEVGKCIRIHPPWKEIHVGNDKSIILSTYFSEISI